MKDRNAMKTISQRLEEIKSDGYTVDFQFDESEGVLKSDSNQYTADKIEIVNEFRFEGPSNPDDMSILYLIQTNDGTKGSIVDGYGISGSPELAEFLMKADS
ncbi:hypothetical protein JKA74_10110 [Marivirga sp. S37H4]|uniref:Phosphoribosylpyrophosphate synthetase n=1 Tax=Marivirga aurantiaca TaxID=2802615 RepID=A0A935C8A2_9BACT|nr:hypothetical protein [Marivirga aurantiaca]MBK6265390.1 hypothetical protein [Marivirga aurantiaca]